MQCVQQAVFFVLCSILHTTWAEYLHLMRTFNGKVGAGNYSYYKLTQEGYIRLELLTIEGDADIYVSDLVLSPEYDNYELQSCTCGREELDIDSILKRPIGIGIYGHPFHEVSRYTLNVYIINPDQTYQSYQSHAHQDQAQHSPHKPKFTAPKEDEESILWSIFVGVLKIIFDILV